jgi:alpha-tubulin suppressor-like RCC1 family protein
MYNPLTHLAAVQFVVLLQVACGGMNSVVLTEGGEVWTWGEPWGEFALELQRAPRKVRSRQRGCSWWCYSCEP